MVKRCIYLLLAVLFFCLISNISANGYKPPSKNCKGEVSTYFEYWTNKYYNYKWYDIYEYKIENKGHEKVVVCLCGGYAKHEIVHYYENSSYHGGKYPAYPSYPKGCYYLEPGSKVKLGFLLKQGAVKRGFNLCYKYSCPPHRY